MTKITQKATFPAAPQKIKAWSISTYNQYEECPKKTFFSKIQKIAEPKNEHLTRGIQIHEDLEGLLKNPASEVPAVYEKVAAQISNFRKIGAIAELELAFDKDWQKCDWFAKNCWVRIKIDVITPPTVDGDSCVTISDWKSGKVSEEHEGYDLQLELYQLAGLLAYPSAEKADAELIFVDHGVVLGADNVITRDMIPALKEKWEKKVTPLMNDMEFAARPSGRSCKWCFYAKAKNGNCEY